MSNLRPERRMKNQAEGYNRQSGKSTMHIDWFFYVSERVASFFALGFLGRKTLTFSTTFRSLGFLRRTHVHVVIRKPKKLHKLKPNKNKNSEKERVRSRFGVHLCTCACRG